MRLGDVILILLVCTMILAASIRSIVSFFYYP